MSVEYRAYGIGPDGHIVTRINLICDDDAVASERAQQLAGHHLVELWQGKRLVGRFEPRD